MKLQIHKEILKGILDWKKSHRDDSYYKLDKATYCCKEAKNYFRSVGSFLINSKGAFTKAPFATINYCPFCGAKIVVEKGETVTLVNKPKKVAREQDHWVKE